MKKLLLCLCLALVGRAQSVHQLQLAAPINDSVTTQIFVNSITLPQSLSQGYIFIDSELDQVTAAVVGPSTGGFSVGFPNVVRLTVTRGVMGTTATSHGVAASIFYGPPAQFIQIDKSGPCSPGLGQFVNIADQMWFTCISPDSYSQALWVGLPTNVGIAVTQLATLPPTPCPAYGNPVQLTTGNGGLYTCNPTTHLWQFIPPIIGDLTVGGNLTVNGNTSVQALSVAGTLTCGAFPCAQVQIAIPSNSVDDTANVQAAVASACSTNARRLYLPGGTYIFSSSVTIPCSMTVYGAARGASTIFNKANSMVGADFIATADNVTFQDLTIDGNQANFGSAFRSQAWVLSNTYVKYNSVVNGTISYIALQNVPASTAITNTAFWLPVLSMTSGEAAASVNSGIGIEGRGNNLLVSNVEVMHEANWGVTINSQVSGSLSRFTLEKSYIHDIGIAAQGNDTTQAGVENYNGTLSDFKIINNTFENIYSPTYGPGFSSAIFMVDASNGEIRGNTVNNCLNARGGTVSADGDGTLTVSNIVYRDNIILQSFYLNQDGTSGIEADGSNNTLISGNIITGIPADGIHAGGQIANAPITNLTITDNTINTSATSSFLVSPDAAIQVGVPVSSTVGGVNGALVSNNTIDGHSVMPHGIYVPITSSNVQGRNNRIKNVIFGEMYDASATANILMVDYSWIGSDTATVSNTTTLTKMYGLADYPLPWGAAAFNGAVMKFEGGGFFNSPASGAGTIALSLYVGSTQVCLFNPVTTPVNTTTGSYSFTSQVTFFSSGATYCSGGSAIFNGNAGSSANTAVTSAPLTVTAGFNPYAAYGVDLAVQFSVASSSLNITNKSMNVWLEYPGARNF